MSEWDNQGALNDNLAKQIAYLEMMNYAQEKINELKVSEQSLRETLGIA